MAWLRTAAAGAVLFATLTAGCSAVRVGPPVREKAARLEKEAVPAAPCQYSFRLSQYVFHSDFELQRNLPIFQELVELREQVYKELHLPPADSLVQVYLFADRERYERYMQTKYPELPRRRAFFVAQPHYAGGPEDLLVYTYWGERIHEDLRHELTHALLHSILKDVPLWLDEGLAEYFEVPPAQQGLNPQHLDQLRRELPASFQPDLVRLEGLRQVQQMTPEEYREAWAWVHLLLRGRPEAKRVLISYLYQLRNTPNPGPLRPRLAVDLPSPEEALRKHLEGLTTVQTATPTVQR